MSNLAQNTPLTDTVTVPRGQYERLVANYKMMLDEKVQMEQDISVLMFVGRRLMSLFQGKNIMKTAADIMRKPDKHKAEFAQLEQLYIKYQHLMPTEQQLLGDGQ